jgi:putative Holliday junction resolvase
MQCIATPHTVIQVAKPEADIAAIQKIAEEQEVVGIVAGLPYNLKGEIGPQAEKVLHFVELLRAAVDLDIEMQDERMTTAMGERMQAQAKVKRKKRKQTIDQIAAAHILQTWLDRAAYRRKAEA